jgi:hypothetical protein
MASTIPNPPPNAPPNTLLGGGIMTVFGAFGTALDIKHASSALAVPFQGCHGVYSVAERLVGMDDTLFLGVLVWVGVLIVSLVTMGLGVLKIYHWTRAKPATGKDADLGA